MIEVTKNQQSAAPSAYETLGANRPLAFRRKQPRVGVATYAMGSSCRIVSQTDQPSNR